MIKIGDEKKRPWEKTGRKIPAVNKKVGQNNTILHTTI